jgi:hypothetical protein
MQQAGAPQGGPPVGVVAPPQQQNLPPLANQPATYREAYQHPANDAFNGNYTNLYNEYTIGTTTPLDLRNALYRDGNTGTFINILVHVRDRNPAAADDPGAIVGYHRLTRRDARFGQVPTPFDNLGLAYFGDVVNGQAPATVVIPDTLYNQVQVVQVPTDARLLQLIAAEPARETFGPFAAGDPDVSPITTRRLVVVPNKYVAPFITSGMTPKAAYLALKGVIQQDGNEVSCSSLLDWLRVAMIHPGPDTPARTCHEPLVAPTFARPEDQQAFATYRLEILHKDLPHLQPGVHHNSAALIAHGITALTDEQRQARQAAELHRQNRDAPKTAGDYFGVLLERVMRWCQVASEEELPPIYEKLANTKKGKIRIVLQTAVEETLTNLRYIEDFPLSPPLSTKIVELKWHSPVKDDFTVGLNIFSLGSLEEETMEDQRRINHHADTIASGEAAPALLDVATIHDTKYDVCVPRTFAQLRYCVERAEALWQVLLGSQHPVTRQHKQYRDLLISQEKRLERTVTRDPGHRYLVPALLARVIQLEVNLWLGQQMRTAAPIPFTQLTDVFGDIERERNWEPTFPNRYLQMDTLDMSKLVPTTTTNVNVSGGSTVATGVSTLTSGGSATGNQSSTGARNVMVRNLAYQSTLFEEFRALGIRIGKLKDSLKERSIPLPKAANGMPMCLAYHVIGHCNERCNNAKNHLPHTDKEYKDLVAWCKQHFNLE